MTTVGELAAALAPDLVELVGGGFTRTVDGVEVADGTESAEGMVFAETDLVLAVGGDDIVSLTAAIEGGASMAGVVVRHIRGADRRLRRACVEADIALLALADDVSWGELLRSLRVFMHTPSEDESGPRGPDDAHDALFDLADLMGGLLAAPVTIEDASSTVVAYLTGQDGVDAARMSSIFGRRVPRPVRDHFRGYRPNRVDGFGRVMTCRPILCGSRGLLRG